MTFISMLWCAGGIALSSFLKRAYVNYTQSKRPYVKSGIYAKKKKKTGLYRKNLKKTQEKLTDGRA